MIVSTFENIINMLWSQSHLHLILEVGLILMLVMLLLRKPEPIHDPKDDLTEAEEDEIIAAWKPKDIVDDVDERDIDQSIFSTKTISSGPSDTIVIDDREMTNMGTPNFYGLNMNEEIVEASLAAIDKYAVGACGPRQFYGTMDAHLDVEKAMADFMGTEDSVNYCYPFATTTSIVQAFVHNTDIVFIDESSWYAIQLGGELTRAKVVLYKHNDCADLREKIIAAKKSFQRWSKCNRWVVTEGLFANDGALLDLPALIGLRKEFCLRLIIDETLSFGSVGATGKGVCEHYNVPRDMVEVSIGSYGPAFASLGGFSIGTKELCAHQRLASHAYIFSASPPCFNVIAATKAIEIVSADGEKRIAKLRSNIQLARNLLKDIQNFEVLGDEISPLIHLRIKDAKASIKEEDEILEKFCNDCIEAEENPVAVTKTKYARSRDKTAPRPSVKIYISQAHSEQQIEAAMKTIKKIAQTL